MAGKSKLNLSIANVVVDCGCAGREQTESIAPVAVCGWRQCPNRKRRPRKRGEGVRPACRERKLGEKQFRAKPALNIWRVWRRWRYGHDKRMDNEPTSMESDGAGRGTAAIGGVWRNRDGPGTLPQAHGGAATPVCTGLGRGGQAALAAGARVLPVTSTEDRKSTRLNSSHRC